jgi:hypothetical protein
MPVPQHAPAAVVGLQIDGRGQKLGHFRFDRLVKSARPRRRRPVIAIYVLAPSRRTSVSRSVKISG